MKFRLLKVLALAVDCMGATNNLITHPLFTVSLVEDGLPYALPVFIATQCDLILKFFRSKSFFAVEYVSPTMVEIRVIHIAPSINAVFSYASLHKLFREYVNMYHNPGMQDSYRTITFLHSDFFPSPYPIITSSIRTEMHREKYFFVVCNKNINYIDQPSEDHLTICFKGLEPKFTYIDA